MRMATEYAETGEGFLVESGMRESCEHSLGVSVLRIALGSHGRVNILADNTKSRTEDGLGPLVGVCVWWVEEGGRETQVSGGRCV